MILAPSRLCSQCDWRFFNVPEYIACPRCCTVDGNAADAERRATVSSHWLPLHRYAVKNAECWDPVAAAKDYDEWCVGIPRYNCSCQANWDAYTDQVPPVFASAREFFEWGVVAHNYVSTHHAKRPTMSLLEATGLYQAPWIVRRPRGIVTLALDDHSQVLEITLPMMQAYARRVGAELFVIESNMRPEYPMANKWRVANYARNFEQTLYVDSDVLIMPGAPDIFAAVPQGFAARDERPDYVARPDWYIGEMSDLFKSQSVSHELVRCANGGVLLMSEDTCSIYEEPPSKPYPQLWCTDQYWLSYRLETTDKPVTWLDDRWNWGFIRHDWWGRLSEAWFVHLNGSRPLDYRVELARRIAAGNFAKFLPPANAGWRPDHA